MKTRGSMVLVVLGMLVALAVWSRGPTTQAPVRVEPMEERGSGEPPALEQPDAQPASRSELPSTANEAEITVHVVVRETRKPLPGLRVVLRPDGGIWSGTDSGSSEGTLALIPTSDAEGRVHFRAPPGAYLLEVRPEGATIREEVQLAAGEVRELDLEVPTAFDLPFFGRVVERSSGNPVAGAEVLLYEPSGYSSGTGQTYFGMEVRKELARTTCDAHGLFSLRTPSWMETYLRVDAPGYLRVFVYPEAGHEDESKAAVVRLEGPASLIVTVTEDGRPAPGIKVALRSAPPDRDNLAYGETDGQGTCRLEVPAARSISVHLTRPDSPAMRAQVEPALKEFGFYTGLPVGWDKLEHVLPDEIVLAPGETRSVQLVLPARCRLHGVVRDPSGQPVTELSLDVQQADPGDHTAVRCSTSPTSTASYSNDSCVTDGEGRYAFKDMPPGDWWVRPTGGSSRSDSLVAQYATRVTIPDGARDCAQDISVTLGLEIHGRVESSGKLVTGAQVRSDDYLFADCDADGRFTLGPLIERTYLLEAWSDGFLSPRPVEAHAGDKDVVLSVVPMGHLTGRVIDASTREPLDAFYWLLDPAVGQSTMTYGSERKGKLACDWIRPGSYSLHVETLDGRFTNRHGLVFAAGQSIDDIELALEHGASLRLYFESAPTRRIFVSAWSGSELVGGGDMHAGTVDRFVLPPGDFELRLEGPAGQWRETLAVSTTLSRETTIVLPALGAAVEPEREHR